MQLFHWQIHVLLFTLYLCLQLVATTRGFTTAAVTTPSVHRQHPAACRRRRRGSAPSASGSDDGSGFGQAEELAQTNLLAQVQRFTTIWADTADVGVVQRFAGTAGVKDVTTNPSIVLATVQRELEVGNFRPPKVWDGYMYWLQIVTSRVYLIVASSILILKSFGTCVFRLRVRVQGFSSRNL